MNSTTSRKLSIIRCARDNLQLPAMAQPQPFTLHVPDSDLTVLETKLSTTRLPRAPDGWTEGQGVPVPEIERVMEYWRTSYLPRWREREAKLNKLPMFKMPVDAGEFGTLNMHFLHKKAKNPAAIPLLFIHGWPGCFLEATKMMDALADGDGKGDGPVFNVVVPSLPNYGFSEGVSKVG
jgi:pimeloyl-ACP methyl ester carboxylesterase